MALVTQALVFDSHFSTASKQGASKVSCIWTLAAQNPGIGCSLCNRGYGGGEDG